jgi:hypothetical protein
MSYEERVFTMPMETVKGIVGVCATRRGIVIASSASRAERKEILKWARGIEPGEGELLIAMWPPSP